MHLLDLLPDAKDYIQQTARVVLEGFKALTPGTWETPEDALEEIQSLFGEGRISRIAVEGDTVLGWVGALNEGYPLVTWELHPLVVHPDYQGKGVGRALVADIEDQARQRGAHTMYLGTDDETNLTSLSGVNLYDNLWQHIATIENRGNHPFTFYQKMGYTIVGVIPDANGLGKPDILMAKRLV